MTNSLVIFSKAAVMLAEADTIQKAKELKSLALTAAEWAKRKNMGEDAIQHCRSYALEAERKMGQMLAETVRAKGTDKAGKPKIDGSRALPSNPPPTLADLGLTKRESAEAQMLAELPEPDFEAIKSGQKTKASAKRSRKKRNGCQQVDESAPANKPENPKPRKAESRTLTELKSLWRYARPKIRQQFLNWVKEQTQNTKRHETQNLNES